MTGAGIGFVTNPWTDYPLSPACLIVHHDLWAPIRERYGFPWDSFIDEVSLTIY